MKRKIFALLTVCAVVLSTAGVSLAVTKGSKKAKSTNQLLALLPPSDGAFTIDAKRFFGDALPQILSANQPLLTEILSKFDEIKATTGIDFKQFQQVAVGVPQVDLVAGARRAPYDRLNPALGGRGDGPHATKSTSPAGRRVRHLAIQTAY